MLSLRRERERKKTLHREIKMQFSVIHFPPKSFQCWFAAGSVCRPVEYSCFSTTRKNSLWLRNHHIITGRKGVKCHASVAMQASPSPRPKSRTSKYGLFHGYLLLLWPISFFWSLQCFFNFFCCRFITFIAIVRNKMADLSHLFASITTFVSDQVFGDSSLSGNT